MFSSPKSSHGLMSASMQTLGLNMLSVYLLGVQYIYPIKATKRIKSRFQTKSKDFSVSPGKNWSEHSEGVQGPGSLAAPFNLHSEVICP